MNTLPTIATSTWSLHRTIGMTWWDAPDRSAEPNETWGKGTITMLNLPEALTANGFSQIHLCHFHVERRDPVWLVEFRSALASANVRLAMVLIDDGDLTHPEYAQRDSDWVRGWIDTAAALGANSARVIAGRQAPERETLSRAVQHLFALVDHGRASGIAICTENWFDLTPGPEQVDYLLDCVGAELGLLADFGNWPAPGKYQSLRHILTRAVDTHAKAHFTQAGMDQNDYRLCLEACKSACYSGPFTLIYDGPSADEWSGLAIERDFIVSSRA